MDDLTLITFNFNTPEVVTNMLQTFVKHNGTGPHKLLLYENSSDEKSPVELEKHKLPFIRQIDARHAPSVDRALYDCKTKYALVVDSDIEFKKRIGPLFDMFIKEGAALMGEVCGSRGGYNLYNRVHPWFMFVDIESIQNHGIRFYDEKRIEETDSCHFYQAVPLLLRYDDVWRYDVGATFYEDVINAGLKVSNYKAEPEYFIHFEGMSWQDRSKHTWLMKHYQQVRNLMYINRQTKAYFKIRIDGCFV